MLTLVGASLVLIFGMAAGWELRKTYVRALRRWHKHVATLSKPEPKLGARRRSTPTGASARAVRNGWAAPRRTSQLLSANCVADEHETCRDSRCECRECDHPAQRKILPTPLPEEPAF